MEEVKIEYDLDTVRRWKEYDIEKYDTSKSVNSFTLKHGEQEIEYWLPANKRNQLVIGVTAWKENHDSYRLDLREYNTHIDIPCDKLLDMLTQLDAYAVACYNATSANLAAINTIEDADEVSNYDITQGYPERLIFEV